jgi:hypothetical protein
MRAINQLPLWTQRIYLKDVDTDLREGLLLVLRNITVILDRGREVRHGHNR